MWNHLEKEFAKRTMKLFFIVVLVFVVAFSWAFAYDDYYNVDKKSFSFAAELGAYIFGACIASALVLSLVPLASWGIKKYASIPGVAARTFSWLHRVFWFQIIFGLIAGSIFGEKFLAGPRAIILWLIELAKSVRGIFT